MVEQPPVVSILWHPLGELGRCLVTINRDAVLRLWEINPNNKLSFGDASLSIDLKKLANATSAEEDLRASRFDAGKAFSPDTVDLEPAAACFGTTKSALGNVWSSMTLWIATIDGDVYTLCPLLPSKWQAYDGLIESLSVCASASYDENAVDFNRWILDIQVQDPLIVQAKFDTYTIYKRPRRPGPVPKLQGPFILDPMPENDFDLSDIYVTETAVSDRDLIEFDDDEDEANEDEQSSTVIFLITTNATIHICLDFEGVEAQWLPSSGTPFSTPSRMPMLPEQEKQPLLMIETVQLYPDPEYSSPIRPAFTPDIHSPHAIFITHATGISYLSIAKWINRLHRTLEESTNDEAGAVSGGTEFRSSILLETSKTLLEHPLTFPDASLQGPPSALHIATAIILQDSDIGYLLLTSLNHQPHAANLDIPPGEPERRDFDALIAAQEKDIEWLLTPREPYHEDQTFYTPTQLLQLLKSVPPHMQNYYREEVRLSPASLDVLIRSHRVVKVEVHRIADSAALLYERCGRLVVDLKEQVGEVGKVADRVDLMAGGWDGEEEGEEGEEDGDRGMIKRIEDRVARMMERQGRIVEGFSRVKRLAVRLDGKEVSEKERAFVREVERLASRLDPALIDEGEDGKAMELRRRFEEVKTLKERLVTQAKQVVQQHGDQEKRKEKPLKVSSEFRKAKESQVMDMLERESALIEAVTERLNRLGV